MDGGMRIPRFSFPDTPEIHLYSLSDVHRGDFACDVDMWRKTVQAVHDDPAGVWVSVGDMLNVGLSSSVSGAYNSFSPGREKEILEKELKPIKNKFLGMVTSNHHNRFDKAVGMSLDRLLIGGWECDPRKFLGDYGCIAISVGGGVYYIGLHHGIGAGRTMGAKINNSERLSDVLWGCDIYLSGHTHSYSHTIAAGQAIDRKRGIISEYPVHYVVGGHCLDYFSSYAPKKLYEPRPAGFAMITLKHVAPGQKAIKKEITSQFIT
jgi:hypothetical protein